MALCGGANLELRSLVATCTLDLGFVRGPRTRPPDMLFHPIEDDAFCIALPPGHPLAEQATSSPQGLDDERFIGYAPSSVDGLHCGGQPLR